MVGFQAFDFIGRGEKTRTSDPRNPIAVRYQAALHPEILVPTRRLTRWRSGILLSVCRVVNALTLEKLLNLFEFHAQLLDQLVTLACVLLGALTGKLSTRSTNRIALLV